MFNTLKAWVGLTKPAPLTVDWHDYTETTWGHNCELGDLSEAGKWQGHLYSSTGIKNEDLLVVKGNKAACVLKLSSVVGCSDPEDMYFFNAQQVQTFDPKYVNHSDKLLEKLGKMGAVV